jgi:hypothetical protein
MKDGDKVIGIPRSGQGEEYPERVIGRLELTPVKFVTGSWKVARVYVQDSDGDETPVICEEESLAPAGRREKVTVLS